MMPSGILGAWAGWYRAASSPGYVPFPSARRSRVPFTHFHFSWGCVRYLQLRST